MIGIEAAEGVESADGFDGEEDVLKDAITKAAELAGIESFDINYYPDAEDPVDQMIKAFYGTPTDEEAMIARVKTLVKEPRVLMLMEPVEIK